MNWDDLTPVDTPKEGPKWDDLTPVDSAPGYTDLAKSKAMEGLGNIGDMREWAISNLPQGLQDYARTALKFNPIAPQVGMVPTSEQLRNATGVKEVQPQGLGQQAFGGAVSALTNPLSYVGAGSLPLKVAGAVAGGAGSAVGGEAGENIGGKPGRVAGSVIGGAVGGGVGGRTIGGKTPSGVAPLKDVKTNASNTYDALTQQTNAQPISVGDLGGLADRIVATLNQKGARPSTASKIHAAVDELRTPATANQGDVTDLVSARQNIKNLLGEKDANKKGALLALPMIETEIEKRAPGTMAQIKAADHDWAIVKANETLNKKAVTAELRAAGDHSGMGLGNKMRQQATNFLLSKDARYLTPEKEAAIKSLATGTGAQNALRFGSNLLGGGGGLGLTMLAGGAALGAGEYAGHPELGLLPFAGLGLRHAYTRSVMGQANRVGEQLRRGSVLTPPTPQPPGMSPLQAQLLRSAVTGLQNGR